MAEPKLRRDGQVLGTDKNIEKKLRPHSREVEEDCIASAMEWHDRRTALSKLRPRCPACDEAEQLWLRNIFVFPAEWKCRICKHVFYKDLDKDLDDD